MGHDYHRSGENPACRPSILFPTEDASAVWCPGGEGVEPEQPFRSPPAPSPCPAPRSVPRETLPAQAVDPTPVRPSLHTCNQRMNEAPSVSPPLGLPGALGRGFTPWALVARSTQLPTGGSEGGQPAEGAGGAPDPGPPNPRLAGRPAPAPCNGTAAGPRPTRFVSTFNSNPGKQGLVSPPISSTK